MSDYYTEQPSEWDQPGEGADVEAAEAAGTRVSRRGKHSRRRRGSRGTVTRNQAEAVLDRYETLSAASTPELEAVAVVLGSAADDVRALTVALASGTGAKHAQAMDDLLAVAQCPDNDRDMAALTLAVGKSGAKRLRAAWELAASLSGRTQSLSGNPVEAARALAVSAVDVAGVLSVVKSLLG